MRTWARRTASLLLAALLTLPTALPALAAEREEALTLGEAEIGTWYYDAARWAVAAGVAESGAPLGGTVTTREWTRMLRVLAPEAELSAPDGKLTRAEAVQSLYALAKPAEKAPDWEYSDVAPGDECYDAVMWARAAGVAGGTAAHTFSPELFITAAQAATMLYRAFRAEEARAFTERSVPVFREKASGETATLLFYEWMPNVAYVDIDTYCKLFFPEGGIRAERTGMTTSVLTSPTGTATVDTQAETLTSANLSAFTNLMSLVQEGMDNVYLDGMPYARYESMSAAPAVSPVTLRLAPYGIDLRADGERVYFPIATLCDVYSDLAYNFAFFSGEKIYVESANRRPVPAQRDGEAYLNALLDNLDRRAERPDLVEFNYRELCFAIDCFYGNPRPATPLHDLLGEKGLDAALAAYERGGEGVGETVRRLLLSEKGEEYLFGLCCLDSLLNDGGHTGILPNTVLYADDDRAKNLAEAVRVLLGKPEYARLAALINDSTQATMDYVNDLQTIEMLRAASYGEGTYFTFGDTAVCVFDTFNPDAFDVMEEYMTQDPETRKLPPDSAGDPITVFLNALYRAEADPEIRNLVIDVSANGGGSLDVVMTMLSLMLGPDAGKASWRDTLAGQDLRVRYEIDRNFDGAFDERDLEPDFSDLNFAVVTSRCSFSCGNLFPSLLRDRGVLIMGEQSGGGACAVQMMATADGLLYQISSARAMLTDKTGASIDGGVPVHVDLIPKNADGSDKTVELELLNYYTGKMHKIAVRDYSELFDPERIAAEVDAYYAAREGLAA